MPFPRSNRPSVPLPLRLRRLVLRRRRLLAALLCCAAAGSTVQALIPAEARSSEVVVAAADLPAGQLLSPDDLRLVSVPVQALPPGYSTEISSVTGQRLATPLIQGSPLTATSLVGTGLLTGAPPGTAAVAVRPADPAMAALLSPGQLVDVILVGPSGLETPGPVSVLAAAAPVLWISPAASAWPAEASAEAGTVVLAAGSDDAAALAAASAAGAVHLVLTGG